MTKEDAQNILLRAFLSTGELPKEIEAVLLLLIQATTPQRPNNSRRVF